MQNIQNTKHNVQCYEMWELQNLVIIYKIVQTFKDKDFFFFFLCFLLYKNYNLIFSCVVKKSLCSMTLDFRVWKFNVILKKVFH